MGWSFGRPGSALPDWEFAEFVACPDRMSTSCQILPGSQALRSIGPDFLFNLDGHPDPALNQLSVDPVECGKHRVARIMQSHKIKALRGYKASHPIAGRPSLITPNRLNREFKVDKPDIEVFYNRTRRHSHLGGIIPDAFERTSA